MNANETTTTVLPEVLRGYTEARADLSSCIQSGNSPDPADIQEWLYVGLQCMATLGATKEELLPVFRGLQVFALAEDPASGFRELHRTLARLDAELGPNKGGFSRLLENALEAGALELPDALELEALPKTMQTDYQGIESLNFRLQAVDQLSHALQVPADLPACAMVLHGMLSDLPGCTGDDAAAALSHLKSWAELRQLPAAILEMLDFCPLIETPEQLGDMPTPEGPLLIPFLMWHLAHNKNLLMQPGPAAEGTAHLMEKAGLPPLEVLQRANW
ncbi:MAG: hypothetical protein CMH56_05870 [Myxococcales bacterium]|nr:hypothetical protein [Myxococcales bacterium]